MFGGQSLAGQSTVGPAGPGPLMSPALSAPTPPLQVSAAPALTLPLSRDSTEASGWTAKLRPCLPDPYSGPPPCSRGRLPCALLPAPQPPRLVPQAGTPHPWLPRAPDPGLCPRGRRSQLWGRLNLGATWVSLLLLRPRRDPRPLKG